MKLLFVIDSLGSGGAQRQMVALAVGLGDRGHSVEFFTYHPEYQHFADTLRDANVRVHSSSKSTGGRLSVLRGLRKLITNGRFDVTLAFMNTPSLYCELVKSCFRYRLIVSERFAYGDKLSPVQKVRAQLHRLANFSTVNSHHQYSRMVREFPWMKDRIQVVYNGVDLEHFSPSEVTPAVPRSILVLGTLIPRKNAVGLIEALGRCPPSVRNALKIRWAGKDGISEADKDYGNRVRALVRECGLENSWEWLGERKDVRSLLSQHQALAHPSTAEGLPNAICEGMASGLPILASRTGDHPHLVREGESGLLFDPEAPDDIAKSLMRFVQMPLDDLRAMGQQSRLQAERLLSLDRYVSEYEQLFERISEARQLPGQ